MHAQLTSEPSTLNSQPSTILWVTPQQLAEIRLQHDIDEMLAGRRPAYPLTRSARRTANPKPHHLAFV